jgi:Cu/Zn superoxide dismutase
MHIHQFGLDKWSTSCNDAGGHYNPIVNYGEISGLYGTINDTGKMTYMASMVKLEGDYNILGRSIVVHNSTGARIGCCAILLSEIDGDITTGWAASNLTCREENFKYSFVSPAGDVTNVLMDNVNYAAHVHKLGNCSNYMDIVYTLPAFNNSMQWNDDTMKIFAWAGRTIVRHNASDLAQIFGCCQVIHRTAQANINNTYVPTEAATTAAATTAAATTAAATTAKSTTGSSVNFVVSLLILFFFVLLL